MVFNFLHCTQGFNAWSFSILYFFNIEHAGFVGELAQEVSVYKSSQKSFNDTTTIAFDTYYAILFFEMLHHFNRHLICCKDRIKKINIKNFYTLGDTLFEKLYGFNIEYNKKETFIKKKSPFLTFNQFAYRVKS